MMVSYSTAFKCFKCGIFMTIVSFSVIIYEVFTGASDLDADDWFESKARYSEGVRQSVGMQHVEHPILLWWTPFTGQQGATRQCGDVQCFFTIDRQYHNHSNIQAFLFYGTDYNPGDLPIPRQSHHHWGLLHEESPKNNYLFSHEETMILFNHTSTFRRHSDYPITTQYLEHLDDLQSTEYLVSVSEKNRLVQEEDLALVAYVQSDCDVPSDRDHLVKMLQRHLSVDSYGTCLHNKDLPKHLRDPIAGMDHKDFFHHLAKYKFILAMENAICEDYITEKFWRPFIIGSVPIVLGSPKAREYIPDNHSAIFVDDFDDIEDLAKLILKLHNDDNSYKGYLEFKTKGVQNTKLHTEMAQRAWGVNDWNAINFIEGFECMVCNRIHDNIKLKAQGRKTAVHQAELKHYGCAGPVQFSDYPLGSLSLKPNSWWSQEYDMTRYIAQAALQLIHEGGKFGRTELTNRANEIKHGSHHDYHR